MDPKTLWKKTAAKVALAPGNVVSGAVAVAASAVLWNPLPLILWGLGSAGWVSFASTAQRYQKAVLAQERQSEEARALMQRASLLQRVQAQLAEPPVTGWVRRGIMPDYLQVFQRLSDIRDRVGRVMAERTELDDGSRQALLQQLDYMLGTYLQFVRERIGYLQILASVRPGGAVDAAPAPSPAKSATPPLPPLPVTPTPNRYQRTANARTGSGTPSRPADDTLAATPVSVEQRLAEIDDKIRVLQDLAQKEPATARTREWHIGILQKQRDLLLDCQKRDQCVVAQLGAFSDAFEVILGRVSASQFSATEIASYMSGVVEQIEETERFVAALRPAMDQLMGGVDYPLPAALPGAGA